MWIYLIISISVFVVGCIVGWLSRRISPVVKAVYYDKSGIASNPPNIFDVIARKTFNFRVTDKYVLSIPQVSAPNGLIALSQMQMLYGRLVQVITDAEKENVSPNGDVIIALSMTIAGLIYSLAKPYSSGGKRLKKAFMKRCVDDSAYLFQISRELIDLW